MLYTFYSRFSLSIFFLSVIIDLTGCSSQTKGPVADLVLTGGKIATINESMPYAEAIAIRADTILAVGSSSEIADFVGPQTEVVELAGRLAIPGFIEGHGHLLSLGRAQMILDLTATKSWAEVVDMVSDAVRTAEPGEWIQGRGWHQEKWDTVPEGSVDGIPTHHSLSAVSPDNPVLLGHASGHGSFANAEALRLSGISSETPDPSGGEILHDVRGEPTGMLRETAQRLVSRAVARASEDMTQEALDEKAETQIRFAIQEALENGVTSFHDAGSSFEQIDMFKRLVDEGRLPIRLYVMISESNEDLEERLPDYFMDGYGDNRLTVRSIKRGIDGALGTHGAWLLEPYEDLASSSGLNTASLESVRETARIAAKYGFQLNVHAIGDRANREILNIFEEAYANFQGLDAPRWRIEHAQHVDPEDLPRFAKLGVIASMQGIHCTSDALWVYRRLGKERARAGAYKWQTLWQSGAIVTNGTDVPVENIDPIASYYATVSRKLADGSVFFSDERLSREHALKSYTLNNAYAAFEENVKGSLETGKLADITVLSKDILTIEEDSIPETRVDMTIVGGKIMFERSI